LSRGRPEPLLPEVPLQNRARTSGKRFELNRHTARSWIVDLVKDAHHASLRANRFLATGERNLDLKRRPAPRRSIELKSHPTQTDIVDVAFLALTATNDGHSAVHRVNRETWMTATIGGLGHA
jgi:hypothetical protein